MVKRINQGQGRPEDIALLDDVAFNIMGRTICALGDAARNAGAGNDQTLPPRIEAKIAAAQTAAKAA